MSHIAYKIIEKAKSSLFDWANQSNISIYKIDFVAVFENWSDSLGVWVFYDTDERLKKYNRDKISENIQEKYLEYLRENHYPFHAFPKVNFEFDSDENVRKNYSGSYFFRLR